MLAKQKEALVMAGLRSNTIRIVDPARAPVFPSHPNVPRNMLIGFLFGLTAGIALAFVQEMLDNTVKTPEEVTYLTALPALGMIPLNKRLTEKAAKAARAGNGHGSTSLARKDTWRDEVELVSHSRPKSEIAEAYRALRTSILLSGLGAPPRCILVTSALPQEGKTTTAINIAIVLAQKGGRVLLVDADMRRPSIHTKLALRARGGLSTLLTGSDTLGNVLVNSTEVPNLHVLPAGPPPPHPAELLGSSVMKSFIAEWREKFDHVIIDSPPCLSVTDAVLLSVEVDAVALVLRSGQTPKDAIRRARNLLFQVQAKVLGVVVNAVDMRSPDMYYYSYASKYGSYYTDTSE
jgi:capsular exopolysaccharide synthesis family protein